MEIFLHFETWVALLTLTFLEVILGIDNLIFISILTSRLPENKQSKARKLGLLAALVARLLFLLMIAYIIRATEPLISWGSIALSARDLILLAGGIFLLTKSSLEIHKKVAGDESSKSIKPKKVSFGSIIFQIVLLDIVFSFDSILTAIGLTDVILIMVIAVIISMIIMMLFIDYIANFILKYPTLQVLGLSFLILIGTMLTAEAFGYKIPKGYIYFALFYAFAVEMINMKVRENYSKKQIDGK